MKFFNTAGPVNCDEHYCLPPIERFDLEDIERLIDQKKYFVLHAPRQTGKTSSLFALMEHLNAGEQYRCLYVNVEPAQAARENVKEAMSAVLNETAFNAFHYLNDDFLETEKNRIMENSGAFLAFQTALSLWTKNSDKPLVLLIDEVDALVGDSLISLLRQLRSGYAKRPSLFPQSVILCGVRDVRDYRIHSDIEKSVVTGGSAFNVKAESLRLGDFSCDEVKRLCRVHTEETGQMFEPGALDRVWELTTIAQYNLEPLYRPSWYVLPDGRLDTNALLAAFQEFFRENSEIWLERFDYKEAGPHLLMQAFLQRIVNSGGRIDREYGLGRGRTDLMLAWNHETGVQKVVIELKILYKSLEATIDDGLEQTADYMDKCGANEGHLVIFDQREGRKWADKIFREEERREGKGVVVWGM